MFFNIVVVLVLFSGLVYVLNDKIPDVLNKNQNYGYVLQAGSVLVFMAWLTFNKKSNLKIMLKNIATWLFIILIVLTGYSYQYELKRYGKTILGHIIPSMGVQHEDGSVTFYASKNGHFMVDAKVNESPIKFLLDTGASKVTLTAEDAQKVGVDIRELSFDIVINTANGNAQVAPLRIKKIQIGNLTLIDVEAFVSKQGLDISLLGMSFLNKLKRYEVESNAITFWN